MNFRKPRGLTAPWTGTFFVLILGLAACGPETPDASSDATSLRRPVVPDSMTIPRMLESDDRFSTLRAALDSTGLDSLLATDGPYTLFAPPNKAFEALPPGTMQALLTNRRKRLRTILAQHVTEGRMSTERGAMPRQIVTLVGDTLALTRTNDGSSLDDASILDANIEASNGLLHVLDRVLPPPSSDERP